MAAATRSRLPARPIPIESRIFAIADVFDALTSRRPYKEPLSFDETMQILDSGRGKHFDPRCSTRFGAIAREMYDRYCGRAMMTICARKCARS